MSEFIQNCMQCLVSRTRQRILWPLTTASHSQNSKKVVNVAYLFMGKSDMENIKYVLGIKDEPASCTGLVSPAHPSSSVATDSVAKLIAAFGSMDWLVSDKGDHLTGTVMSQLTSEAHRGLHFSPAYCLWANGTVERICKEALRTSRALLSEWHMAPSQ